MLNNSFSFLTFLPLNKAVWFRKRWLAVGIVVCFLLTAGQTWGQESGFTSTPEPEHFVQMIQQLGAPDYLDRERAKNELREYGSAVKPYLRSALDDKDPEIALQARYLLDAIPDNWIHSTDSPELKEWLALYRKSSPLSRPFLAGIIKRLPPEQQKEAVLRVWAMNPNEAESVFLAAVFWLQISRDSQATASSGDADSGKRAPSETESTAGSTAGSTAESETLAALRVRLADPIYENVLGAKLIRAFMDYPQNRDQACKILEQCAQKRNEALSNIAPQDSSALYWYIGYPLAHFGAEQLRRQYPDSVTEGKTTDSPPPDANQSPSISSAFSAGLSDESVESPTHLWSFLLDLISNGQFVSEDSALSMIGALPLIGPLELCACQSPLGKQWARDWIDWELVVKSDKSKPNVSFSLNGQTKNLQALEEYLISVAETLHDFNLDEFSIAVVDKIPEQNRRPEKNARYWYYRACQFQQEKKRLEQWAAVQKALEQDPGEVDSLIMRWEMCQQTPEEIQSAKLEKEITPPVRDSQDKQIDDYLNQLEQRIEANEGNSSLQNEYAWLAVKTNRKLSAALTFAQQAVAANPQSAACMDTLAHVLAATGEWDEAIKTQKQAVQQDPFSQTLYVTLLRFQKEAAKNTK